MPWGLWITIDLSAIALGAGAFTLSAVVYIFGIKRFQPLIRLAVFVGFIGYTSALLTLVMDIGRPDRFWHPWVYWNIHSVLWEITWCITIYLTIMLLEFLPVIAESRFFDRAPWFRKMAHTLHKAAPARAVLGLIYVLNPNLGILEFIPDNLPLVGNLDEGAAFLLVWYGILEYLQGKKPPTP